MERRRADASFWEGWRDPWISDADWMRKRMGKEDERRCAKDSEGRMFIYIWGTGWEIRRGLLRREDKGSRSWEEGNYKGEEEGNSPF